jgi:hypothetical protein
MRALPLAAALLLAGVARGEDPALAASTAAADACTSSGACVARLGRGHVCAAGRCAPYFDRRDLYGVVGLRSGAPRAPEPLVPLVAAVPVVGYSPASGVQVGFAGTVAMLLGDPEDTTISSATGSLLGTSKNQVIFQIAGTTMTPGNGWELLSDFRYLEYNQDTYGLGTGGTPLATGISVNGLGQLEEVPGGQPMDFSLVRVHQSALRHVAGSVYVGAGYRLDHHFSIVDRRLDLGAPTPVVTSHYGYSRAYGFDPGSYTASGLSLEAISDTRDSTIAPYRGWYALLRLAGYPTWLGSTRASTLAQAEGRAYLGLSDDDPRSVLALWGIVQGVTSGHLPYLALPAIGWHPASTTGRGYVQGRFRGTAMAYAEAEWRFRLTGDGLLGGTIFANAETFARPALSLPAYGVSEQGERLFDAIRPAGGVGLRVLLLKQSRTALRIDLAGGRDSICFYFGAGEAF